MSETLLITDRGYKSMSNIQKQLDVGLKFLQCTPLNEKSVRALIDKHSYQLKGIEFYEPKYHCSAVALPTEECESWLQRLPGSGSIQSVKSACISTTTITRQWTRNTVKWQQLTGCSNLKCRKSGRCCSMAGVSLLRSGNPEPQG